MRVHHEKRLSIAFINKSYTALNRRKDIPPFGYEIDYMTFGGIYREVSLRVVPALYLDNIFALLRLNHETDQAAITNALPATHAKEALDPDVLARTNGTASGTKLSKPDDRSSSTTGSSPASCSARTT